jgi:Uma2 family endonuclease
VCDPEKTADPRSIDGAPEMVIEILSPGNTRTETKYKLDLYEENGVEEYWVVFLSLIMYRCIYWKMINTASRLRLNREMKFPALFLKEYEFLWMRSSNKHEN